MENISKQKDNFHAPYSPGPLNVSAPEHYINSPMIKATKDGSMMNPRVSDKDFIVGSPKKGSKFSVFVGNALENNNFMRDSGKLNDSFSEMDSDSDPGVLE